DRLASDEDLYRLVIRPETAGYLYVFQLDSHGRLVWMFPRNPTWEYSSGANPILASGQTQIPPQEKDALPLDDNVGLEHIFVVFSVTRWPQLEDALKQAAEERSDQDRVPEPFDGTRGVEDDPRGPGAPRPAPEIVSGENGERLELSAREQTAAGCFM